MPRIPVDIASLSTEFEPLDESLVYHVVCKSCDLSDTTDKNGNNYLKNVRLEVVEPEEWRGRNIFMNYIGLPAEVHSGTSVVERRAVADQARGFARFIAALKVPFDSAGFDTEDAIGCEGDVTIQIEEYQGRKNARVRDWLI